MKDKIIVYGMTFVVNYVEHIGEGIAGTVDWENNKLLVVKDKDQDKTNNSVLHEAIHTLFRRLEMYQVISHETEELLVANLCTFMAENYNCKLRKIKKMYKS